MSDSGLGWWLDHNSLIVQSVREILRGEAKNWTWADWRAITTGFVTRDAGHIAAFLILDYTGPLGRAVAAEVLHRRSINKARAIGSDIFCIYHDCGANDCVAEHRD